MSDGDRQGVDEGESKIQSSSVYIEEEAEERQPKREGFYEV